MSITLANPSKLGPHFQKWPRMQGHECSKQKIKLVGPNWSKVVFVVPAPSLPVGWSGTVKSQLSNLSIFRSSAVLNILGHLFTIIFFCLSLIRLGQTMSACLLTFTNSCFLSSMRCICSDSVCIEICFPSKFRIPTTWIVNKITHLLIKLLRREQSTIKNSLLFCDPCFLELLSLSTEER